MARILTGTGNILRRNSDNMIVRAYESTDTINLQSDKVVVTNSSNVGVETWTKTLNYNSSTMTVHTNVSLPSGYADSKFTYDGSSWAQDSNWVDRIGADHTKILADINNSTTSIVVNPVCNGMKDGETIQIGSEKMTFKSYTHNSGDTQHTMTVIRGIDSTTAAAHSAGAMVYYPLFD